MKKKITNMTVHKYQILVKNDQSNKDKDYLNVIGQGYEDKDYLKVIGRGDENSDNRQVFGNESKHLRTTGFELVKHNGLRVIMKNLPCIYANNSSVS